MIAPGQRWLDKRTASGWRRIAEVGHVEGRYVTVRSWHEERAPRGWVRTTKPRSSRSLISGFIARHTRIKEADR